LHGGIFRSLEYQVAYRNRGFVTKMPVQLGLLSLIASL
jgi:hypothetical protein